MTAAGVICQLEAALCTLRLLPDGRVRLRGPGDPPQPPPPHLVDLVRHHRDEIATLLADGAAAALTQPGVLPGDPSPPLVHPDATRTLAALELVGAGPTLQRDGSIRLAHPQRADADLLADIQQCQADITALLRYRAAVEASRPADMPLTISIASALPQSALPYWLDPGRPEPPSDLVDRLAAVLLAQAAANPAMRITDPDRARGYFEAQARTQLMRLAPPAERLALVEAEEARAAVASAPDTQSQPRKKDPP